MTGINMLAEYTAGGVPVEIALGLLIIAAIGLFLTIVGITAQDENFFRSRCYYAFVCVGGGRCLRM